MDSVEENKVHDAKETSQKVQEPSILESHTLAISVDKKELDVAGEFLAIHGEEHGVYTREEEKRVLRYIDWRLLPLMLVTQTVAPLDKNLLSNAALYGMTKDLGLKGQEYSWAGSMLYVGFLVGEFPAEYMILKLPVGKLLRVVTCLFATLCALLAPCNNASSLLAVRFLMGMSHQFHVVEKEGTADAYGYLVFPDSFGLISYGIGNANTAIASWKLLFIALGGFTFLWGILVFFTMPENPVSAKFLSDKERYIFLHRMRDNKTGVENKVCAFWHLVFSLAMANTSGHTKKVTLNGILMVAYCVGDILAPQFFRSSEAPNYPTGYNAIVAGSAIAMASLIAYEIVCRLENHKKDKKYGHLDHRVDDDDTLDITDTEKRAFPYIY